MEPNLDKVFEYLKAFDWGKDAKPLQQIDDAIVATHDKADARKALVAKLNDTLKASPSHAVVDYTCRHLMIVGTAESVPALAALLSDRELSHMGRYALERIQAPEAAAALRNALTNTTGEVKAGVIGSLGARRDAESVPALAAMLDSSEQQIANAAACALGDIGSVEAAKALGTAVGKTPENVAVTDACLVCAERLLADGKKPDAIGVYKLLSKAAKSKNVRLAATRGLLDASKKK
jgi:HEAT repeat protein